MPEATCHLCGAMIPAEEEERSRVQIGLQTQKGDFPHVDLKVIFRSCTTCRERSNPETVALTTLKVEALTTRIMKAVIATGRTCKMMFAGTQENPLYDPPGGWIDPGQETIIKA